MAHAAGAPGRCPRILAERTDPGQPDPVGPLLPHGPNPSPVRRARDSVEDVRIRMRFRSPLGCGERKDGPRSSSGPTGLEIWAARRADLLPWGLCPDAPPGLVPFILPLPNFF